MGFDGGREPVRPADSDESIRLTKAAQAGPYIAWRAGRRLEIHPLGPRTPATIGRTDGSIRVPHPQVSREHAEVTVRVHGAPPATSVYLLDHSRHGTEHRRVMQDARGPLRPAGAWMKAPQSPARPHQLGEGFHDLRIARELCLLIGGVPVDDGMTADRDETVIAPTVRQRQVLVELCRPFFERPGLIKAPPTNAEIALRIDPPMTEEGVRNHLSDMYKRYKIVGSSGQNRLTLVSLALENDLVDASDYL
jgi:hypothetical protein